MATTGMYKLDDGNCFPTNCFPARSLLRPRYQEGAGHWQVARRTAEETKIELLFCAKSSQSKWKAQAVLSAALRHLGGKTLDGAHLVKLHHVKTPSDLCSVNISNQNFASAQEEDFEEFTSVAYINATENLLTLEAFRKFPELRELELSLNGLRSLKINAGDFPHLEVLDLSYNNLSPDDVQVLGVLPHLKVLHLTANGLNSLPLDLAVPESENCPRFPALEVLLLDDNHLSHPNVFVSLANLHSLKQLNLDKNGLKEVPYLHHIDHARFSIHPLSAKSGIKEGLRSRKTARRRLRPEGSPRRREKPEYIILHSTKDPNRTEVLFPSWSPEPTVEEDPRAPVDFPETSSASGISSEFTLPLPELRFLSLANNQIEHEEDLLAVALFPSLTELTFYGNPFTILRSGDPPLLTSFLQNKLGIKLVRKKVSKLEKPHIFIPVKANRKVTSRLPKVRRRPRVVEAPLETTFWQLWTGADLLGRSRAASRDGPWPLPSIRSCSTAYDFNMRILSTLKTGEISAPYSQYSSFSEGSSLTSVSQLLSEESAPASESSLNQLLFKKAADPQSSLEMLLESVSREEPQSPLEPAPDAAPGPADEVQPETPPPGQDGLEAASVSRGSLAGKDRTETAPAASLLWAERDGSGLLAPPNSPRQDLEEPGPASPAPAERLDLPGIPATAEPGQPQPGPPLPASAVPEEGPSEWDPLTGPRAGEQAESPPPASSEAEEPPKAFPAPGPPGADRGQVGLLAQGIPSSRGLDGSEQPLASGPHEGDKALGAGLSDDSLAGQAPKEPALPDSPQRQDLSGAISWAEPPEEEQDFSEPLPAEEDGLGSPPSPDSPVQEEELPESLSPAGRLAREQGPAGSPSVEPNLSQVSAPRGSPPEDQPQLGPEAPASSASQEPNPTDAEPPTELPAEPNGSSALPPPADSLTAGWETPQDRRPPHEPSSATPRGSLPFLTSSRSSSRELYELFARIHPLDVSSGRYDDVSTEDEMLSSGEEFMAAETAESFFMTQVDDAYDRLLETTEQPSKDKLTGPSQAVPEKYRGYEELLGGDPGPDFVEPVGIQHNVQALEKALRYPRVYRDSKARLDSFRKPYVPAYKKVLRVVPQQPHKDKVERLEEILLRMREPTNIVHVPLVCILRKKKENWREYREALALLKEFRAEYKAAVTSCNEDSESKTANKKLAAADQRNPSQMFGPLPEITVSEPEIEESPAEETACVGFDEPSGMED